MTHPLTLTHHALRAQFNLLYEESIDKSEKAALPSKRMANIMDHLTWEIYLYIQRGLFERHKLVFALILATKIWTSAGKVGANPCLWCFMTCDAAILTDAVMSDGIQHVH